MKNLPVVILVLVAFSLSCGLMKRFANSTSSSNSSMSNTSSDPGSSSTGSDSAPPSGDPKTDVITASKKFLDLPKFAANMSGQSSQGNMTMALEYQAPDRFHMTTSDAKMHTPTEMIMIGKDMYMQFGGHWQKIPNTNGASMPNLRQFFDEEGVKSLQDVKYEGDDTVDGKPMHLYSYHNNQTNANMPFTFNSKIWVGSADGLPHKIEVTYDHGELKNMTINYDFEKSVDIQPPVK